MHVYFVRHGQTNANRKFAYQSPNAPLNEVGLDEARSVAEFLRPMNPSLLLSSTFERALQTARVIGQSIGIQPTPNSLFSEVLWPSNLIDHSLYSFGALRYAILSTLFRNNPKWRYRDAENFNDVHVRIALSLRFIESFIEAHESIVVVSHSGFINLLMRFMCNDNTLGLRELVGTYANAYHLENGEIVHLEYIGPTARGTCPWLLHTSR